MRRRGRPASRPKVDTRIPPDSPRVAREKAATARHPRARRASRSVPPRAPRATPPVLAPLASSTRETTRPASATVEKSGIGASERPTSANATASSFKPKPWPPCASGIASPTSPSSAPAFFHSSRERPSPDAITRRVSAIGALRSKKRRSMSRNSTCSGLRLKSGSESGTRRVPYRASWKSSIAFLRAILSTWSWGRWPKRSSAVFFVWGKVPSWWG